MALKVLVCGDIRGEFDQIFSKVAKLQKKNNFAVLFCVGDFFGAGTDTATQLAPYISGEKEVPIPTYFILGKEQRTEVIDAHPDGGEVCKNLHYLGRWGIKDVHGLKVAFLSVHSYCCYTVVTLLSHCCYTAVTLL
jgi:hypothetical protein